MSSLTTLSATYSEIVLTRFNSQLKMVPLKVSAQLLESPDPKTLAQLLVFDNQFVRFGKVERRQLQVHIAPLSGRDIPVFSRACVSGSKKISRVAPLKIGYRRKDMPE